MSRRPHDWHPLSGGDPVPGDPHAVSKHARHHRDVAKEIREQAKRLRKLSRTSWESDAGKVFATKAEEAAGKLEQVVERYEVVGSQLEQWVAPLESAQSTSVSLLAEAKDAEARMKANANPIAQPGPPPSNATPAAAHSSAASSAAAAEHRRAAAFDAAAQDLARARKRLEDVVSERDDRAKALARQIKDAAEHDGLKDSRFERFKSWVSDHAKILKTAANILGWIATGLAVAALFISGAGILLLLGGVLLTQLALHSALAASGEGDWIDVAIDIVGIALLFGGGAALLRGGRAAAGRATTTGARTASRTAASQRRAANAALKRTAVRTAQSRSASSGARASARGQLQAMKEAERRAGQRAAQQVRRQVTDQGGRLTQLGKAVIGDRQLWQTSRQLELLAKRFPNDAAVQAAIRAARTDLYLPRAVLQSAYYYDFLKHGNEIWEQQGNRSLLPKWQHELGSRW